MSVNKTFRIGFDARLAGRKHAGIGRYSENLILKLIELAAKNNQVKVKFVIFFFDTEQAKEVLSQFFNHPNVEVVITNIKHYGLQEQ